MDQAELLVAVAAVVVVALGNKVMVKAKLQGLVAVAAVEVLVMALLVLAVQTAPSLMVEEMVLLEH
jgi:hypothetical protein